MAFISNELSKLGQHLPQKRIPLSTLLESEKPCYISKVGISYRMRRQELEKIAGLIPKALHHQIRLPLIFLKEGDTFRLSGNKLEAWLVENILGNTNKLPAFLEIINPKMTIYNYEFQRLRRAFPTLVTFAIIRLG